MYRIGDFVKRWRTPILFVIVIGLGFGGFRRQEANDAATRNLVVQNKELTLQIQAQSKAQQAALCDSRVQSRAELRQLLLNMVADVTQPGRPNRIELEARINEALGQPPEDCR